jgi:hypothetical protein
MNASRSYGRTLAPIEPDEHLLAPPVGIAITSEGLDAATLWAVSELQIAVKSPENDPVMNAWQQTQPQPMEMMR